jgi:hypothetical protein
VPDNWMVLQKKKKVQHRSRLVLDSLYGHWLVKSLTCGKRYIFFRNGGRDIFVPVLQAEDLVSVMPMKNCRDIIGPTRREIIVSYFFFAFLVFSCYFVFYFEIEAKVCLISLNKEIKNKK